MGAKWERKVLNGSMGSYLMTLPKNWCQFHGIKPGDTLIIIDDGNGLVIRKEEVPN
jgi:phosphate uptake regulator